MPSKSTGSTCATGANRFSDHSASGSTKCCEVDRELCRPIWGMPGDLALIEAVAEVLNRLRGDALADALVWGHE